MTKKVKKKGVKPVSQVCNMEITIALPRQLFPEPFEKGDPCVESRVVSPFRDWCKKFCYNWIFQVEDSDMKFWKVHNPHIQASVRLINKQRPGKLSSLLCEALKSSYTYLDDDGWFKPGRVHCSPTVKFNAPTLNYKYCTKCETRIDGPYADETVLRADKMPPMDRKWQKFLIKYLEDKKFRNNREILNVYDPNGGSGKTTFQKWYFYNQEGNNTSLVDFSGSLGQVLAATVNAGPKVNYFMNLPWKVQDKTPRQKEKLAELGSAIESIKDGFLSTSYYGLGKTICFAPPIVVVFSNQDISEYDLFAPSRLSTIMVDENGSDFTIHRELGNVTYFGAMVEHRDKLQVHSNPMTRLHCLMDELGFMPEFSSPVYEVGDPNDPNRVNSLPGAGGILLDVTAERSKYSDLPEPSWFEDMRNA